MLMGYLGLHLQRGLQLRFQVPAWNKTVNTVLYTWLSSLMGSGTIVFFKYMYLCMYISVGLILVACYLKQLTQAVNLACVHRFSL